MNSFIQANSGFVLEKITIPSLASRAAAATALRNELMKNITNYLKEANSTELAALLFMVYLLFKA